jgi:hypothetical protein
MRCAAKASRLAVSCVQVGWVGRKFGQGRRAAPETQIVRYKNRNKFTHCAIESLSLQQSHPQTLLQHQVWLTRVPMVFQNTTCSCASLRHRFDAETACMRVRVSCVGYPFERACQVPYLSVIRADLHSRLAQGPKLTEVPSYTGRLVLLNTIISVSIGTH